MKTILGLTRPSSTAFKTQYLIVHTFTIIVLIVNYYEFQKLKY
jgi:hypothetical protein